MRIDYNQAIEPAKIKFDDEKYGIKTKILYAEYKENPPRIVKVYELESGELAQETLTIGNQPIHSLICLEENCSWDSCGKRIGKVRSN